MNKKRTKIKIRNKEFLIFVIFSVIAYVSLVSTSPVFQKPFGTPASGNTSYLVEDTGIYFYNFSNNVSDDGLPTQYPWTYTLILINSTLYSSATNPSFYYWFSLNSTTSILTIDSLRDNQTGKFNVSILVSDGSNGDQKTFYFIINATNDAPNFTNISTSYNFSANRNNNYFINASDEENHYPFYFNVTYVNCSHASWSNKNDCNLFNLTNVRNSSARFNYTPNMNEVGVYTANISVMDYGANYTCSSGYCDPNYQNNRTSYREATIYVFADLLINTSDCENRIFQENQNSSCIINITSIGLSDTVYVSSLAYLRNYAGPIFNQSWFYSGSNITSTNFFHSINVTIFPGKTEVGNWTINITAYDYNFNRTANVSFKVYVNRTYNANVTLEPVSNITTSIYLLTTINLRAFDNDLLIPDKNESFGGYNEITNFTRRILNRSNLNQELNNINNFDIQIVNMPVSGTNRTEATISFTPNSTAYGNFTINLTVRDKENSSSTILFNLTIIQNSFPYFLSPFSTTSISNEGDSIYLNLSQNATDPDGDNLNYSYTLDNAFSSFTMTNDEGIISFTSNDLDVGQHLVTVSLFDGYLTNSTVLNFTIYNINDPPIIEEPILQADLINGTVDGSSNVNITEGKNATIGFWIDDDDFRILQKSFYNESLTMNLTISGINTHLFTLSRNSFYPAVGSNRAKYEAIFVPNRTDVGSYVITINATDRSGLTDGFVFNLNIEFASYPPSYVNIQNHSTAVNRTLNYRINVTDLEDGNSSVAGNYNFTYVYNFLNGTDFIKNNQSIFNKSTGQLTYRFNDTQSGKYRINVSVNDSSGKRTDDQFWIFVYNAPTIIYPPATLFFNLTEESPYTFILSANHSIQNNLSYVMYVIDTSSNSVISNRSFMSNGSNISFTFTPNTRNATGGIVNMTLFVYPSDSYLTNSTQVNSTRIYNISIANTNDNLSFSGLLGGSTQTISGGSPQSVVLSDYFSDDDAIDPYINQTIGFSYNLIYSSGGPILIEFINWTQGQTPRVTFSSTFTTSAIYNIIGYEYDTSNSSRVLNTVTSNNFSVNLSVPPIEIPIAATQTSGGGSTSTPVAFKLIAPGMVSAYAFKKIMVPLNLYNKGLRSFYNIRLSSIGLKDGNTNDIVETTLDKTFFSTLAPGANENVTLTVYMKTNATGNYEVLVNATSESPMFSDSAKIFINLQKFNTTENETESELNKFLVFVEEFIVQNPQCLELVEMMKEANELLRKGDISNARLKAEQVLNACKDSISQPSKFRLNPVKYILNQYLLIATFLAIGTGIAYYYFRRRQISKGAAIKFYN